MATCDDFSNLSCCGIRVLAPAWLSLVAAAVPEGAWTLRQSGETLYARHPAGLLLTMFANPEGYWAVRGQSLLPDPSIGSSGRPYSVIGVVPLDIDTGYGDPRVAAAVFTSLLVWGAFVAQVQEPPHPRLLMAWRVRSAELWEDGRPSEPRA